MIPEYRLKTKVPYVIAVEGEGLGSCKSLSLAVLALMAYRSGYKIYTNMDTLKLPHKNFYDEILPYLNEFLSGDRKMPQNSFYMLDDVNKVAESRRAVSKLQIDLSQFMQDVRKARSFFAYSIPILLWTEVRFYDVTDLVIDASFDSATETVFWTIWDPAATRIRGHRYIIGKVSADARCIYPFYDSWEKIDRPDPAQIFGDRQAKVINEDACKRCGSSMTRYRLKTKDWICRKCGYSWSMKKLAKPRIKGTT